MTSDWKCWTINCPKCYGERIIQTSHPDCQSRSAICSMCSGAGRAALTDGFLRTTQPTKQSDIYPCYLCACMLGDSSFKKVACCTCIHNPKVVEEIKRERPWIP